MAANGLRESLVSFLEGNTLTQNLILKPIRDYRISQTYKSLLELKEYCVFSEGVLVVASDPKYNGPESFDISQYSAKSAKA